MLRLFAPNFLASFSDQFVHKGYGRWHLRMHQFPRTLKTLLPTRMLRFPTFHCKHQL
jgi:hypothetical protein